MAGHMVQCVISGMAHFLDDMCAGENGPENAPSDNQGLRGGD